MLVNNIQRWFPTYWWSPEELGSWWRRHSNTKTEEMETAARFDISRAATIRDSTNGREYPGNSVVIMPGLVTVTESLYLTVEERMLLESISQRLQWHTHTGSDEEKSSDEEKINDVMN